MRIRRNSTRIAAVTGPAVLVTGLVLVAPWPASAAEFQVTTEADSGAGSLRQAIVDANVSPGPDTIPFPPGVASIHLVSPPPNRSGVDIQGPGMGSLTIGRGTTTRFDQISV